MAEGEVVHEFIGRVSRGSLKELRINVPVEDRPIFKHRCKVRVILIGPPPEENDEEE